MLLLIPGSPSDAFDFSSLAPLLADRYTVVAYDRRGISRSRLDAPPADLSIETEAEDAHRLLSAVSREPASVFGSSGGGQVGLALTARAPDHVRTLVAHEPPAAALLPEGDVRRAAGEEVYQAYREYGVGPAIQLFLVRTGLSQWPPEGEEPSETAELSARMQEKLARMQPNLEFFLSHVMRPTGAYLPDAPALRAARARVVVAVGAQSTGQFAHDAGLALAERLGTRAVLFPGGHAGFFTHPRAFAEKLHEVLQAKPPRSRSPGEERAS